MREWRVEDCDSQVRKSGPGAPDIFRWVEEWPPAWGARDIREGMSYEAAGQTSGDIVTTQHPSE